MLYQAVWIQSKASHGGVVNTQLNIRKVHKLLFKGGGKLEPKRPFSNGRIGYRLAM